MARHQRRFNVPFYDEHSDGISPISVDRTINFNLGAHSARQTVEAAERDAFIHKLREENESPAPTVTRSCRFCFIESPHSRSVFTSCGHIVCRVCALKVAREAHDAGKKLECALCQTETGFVNLFEDSAEELETCHIQEQNRSLSPISRSCRVCFTVSPHQRVVFTACGHILCRACAEQLKYDAKKEFKPLVCPFCRAESGFVPLVEDPISV